MTAAASRQTDRYAAPLPAAIALLAVLFGCAPPAPSHDEPGRASTAAKLVCAATTDGFAPDRGLGGTGAPTRLADRGIGGTGAPVRIADRGIGGTGAPTSVKGTITGFASVCVNGLEIGYDPSHTVDIDGVDLAVSELRVGQVVTLRVDGTAGALMAADITVRHAVSGPIEELENGGINLVVAGQAVLLGVGSPGADQLRPGQWVEVSGLRHPGGYIVAARADVREPGLVTITGRVVGRPGAFRIGGARLQGELAPSLLNSTISVTGDYADGVLTARRAIVATNVPTGQAGVAYVEAFAKATKMANGAMALQIGDDITADMAPGFGEPPPNPTLLVLALHQSVTGELTALAQYDGRGSGTTSTAAATQTVTTTTALAPHATTTTAIATSTTASSTAGTKATATTPAAAIKAPAAPPSTSKAATTSATSTSTSKGSTAGATSANAASTGSAATGKGGGTSTGGTGSGGGAAASPTKK